MTMAMGVNVYVDDEDEEASDEVTMLEVTVAAVEHRRDGGRFTTIERAGAWHPSEEYS